MSIAERLAAIRARIDAAARRASRDPADVRLVAVSKTQPVEAIREAYAAGQRLFGENYVQELVQKADALTDLPDLSFHFIGHLQRNKARDAARAARVVETVDRPELATELDRRAVHPLDVFVEVDLVGEEQKAGCAPGEVDAVLRAIAASQHLRAVGLMAIPPATSDPESTRPHFRSLRRLRDTLRGAGHVDLRELSMGMSADFEIAVEEGATFVRVGTAIFGDRRPRER